MEMKINAQIQQKKYKETNAEIFYKVYVKPIKDALFLSNITGSELKVLHAISSCINSESKAFPSQRYISKLTNLSVSTVSRTVVKLRTKVFLGEPILQVEKKKEQGNKFTNNRYILSPKVGIKFGVSNPNEGLHKTIPHLSPTNKNKTYNENNILKKNQTVTSLKKVDFSQYTQSLRKPYNSEIQKDKDFLFYAKLLAKEDKFFNGNIDYAQRSLIRNIQDMGLENWKDLIKNLANHPSPFGLLQHIRFCVSQKRLSYEEAWKEWNEKH